VSRCVAAAGRTPPCTAVLQTTPATLQPLPHAAADGKACGSACCVWGLQTPLLPLLKVGATCKGQHGVCTAQHSTARQSSRKLVGRSLLYQKSEWPTAVDHKLS
jgi:hypothetical protein